MRTPSSRCDPRAGLPNSVGRDLGRGAVSCIGAGVGRGTCQSAGEPGEDERDAGETSAVGHLAEEHGAEGGPEDRHEERPQGHGRERRPLDLFEPQDKRARGPDEGEERERRDEPRGPVDGWRAFPHGCQYDEPGAADDEVPCAEAMTSSCLSRRASSVPVVIAAAARRERALTRGAAGSRLAGTPVDGAGVRRRATKRGAG